MIVSDYGHHPDSLRVVLQAFREHDPEKKIIAVFQPHQARRVLEFWNPFREILKQFDDVVMYSIYAARESLDELKSAFSQHDLQDVESFDQLGERFAEGVGEYITDQEDVFSLLQQAS